MKKWRVKRNHNNALERRRRKRRAAAQGGRYMGGFDHDCCYMNVADRHRSGVSTRISILMLLLAVLLFMSGCVERKIDGDVIL